MPLFSLFVFLNFLSGKFCKGILGTKEGEDEEVDIACDPSFENAHPEASEYNKKSEDINSNENADSKFQNGIDNYRNVFSTEIINFTII